MSTNRQVILAALLAFIFGAIVNPSAWALDKQIRGLVAAAAMEMERAATIADKCFEGHPKKDEVNAAAPMVRDILNNLLVNKAFSASDLEIIRDYQAIARKEQRLDYQCSDPATDVDNMQNHLRQTVNKLQEVRTTLLENLDQ